MASKNVIPILKDSYLVVIKNSVGAKTWRNLYAQVNGRKKDILKRGKLSCAFFVSSILVIFKLTKEIHATVNGLIKDLKKSGWQVIKRPKLGSVLVWQAIELNGDVNRHIGFYIGQNKAVSNDYKTGQPIIHHFTFGLKKTRPIRKIEAIYWHKKLN